MAGIASIIWGIKDLVIWGFDLKYDYDHWTWMWFMLGLLFIGYGVYTIIRGYERYQLDLQKTYKPMSPCDPPKV